MRLFCFGDSNTYGYDPRGFWGGRYACEDRWPDLLAQQTGIHVENLGSNGAEIPSCADAISPQLRESDYLLVMLGTNNPKIRDFFAKMFAGKKTAKEENVFYGSVQKLYEQLENRGFFMPHKSYLVNYRLVKVFQPDCLLLTNGERIPIAKGKRKEVAKMQLKLEKEGI